MRRESGLYYLQSRYYDPNTGRFINADASLYPRSSIIGNNLFTYCFNNPSSFLDPSGHFPWLIVAIVAVLVTGGAIWGYTREDDLLENAREQTKPEDYSRPETPINTSELHEQASPTPGIDGIIPETLPTKPIKQESGKAKIKKELTTSERVSNTLVGAAMGALVAGAVVASVGVGAIIAAGSSTVVISAFGLTGMQTVAVGSLTFNSVAIFLPAFSGIEIEPMEFEP